MPIHTTIDDTKTVADFAGVQAMIRRCLDFDGKVEERCHRGALKHVDEEGDEKPYYKNDKENVVHDSPDPG